MDKNLKLTIAAVAVVGVGIWYFTRQQNPEKNLPENHTAGDAGTDDKMMTVQALANARAAGTIDMAYYTEVQRAVMAGTADNQAVRDFLAGYDE